MNATTSLKEQLDILYCKFLENPEDLFVALEFEPLTEELESVLAIAECYYKIQYFDKCGWICEQTLLFHPDQIKALWLLSEVYLQKNEIEAAIEYTEQFVAIANENVNGYQRLGILWKQIGNIKKAEQAFQKVFELAPESPEAKMSKALLLIDEGRKVEAIQQLESLPEQYRENIGLLYKLAELNESVNRTEQAISCYQKIFCLDPDQYPARFKERLILPMLYSSEEEISHYRQRLTKGLEIILKELTLATNEEQQRTLSGISVTELFALSYQGFDDLELQRQYGQIIHRTMGAIYPQWMRLPPKRNVKPRIRVGYYSHFIQAHAATQWAFGWLKHHNPDDFEIFCYHTGATLDEWTRRFASCSDHFRHLPLSLEQIVEQVRADELDILVFLEIGQVTQTIQVASLRLAPVQCNSWGHPITSGLPNIDYYLSSEFFEEEEAERYYTEKLVLLPKIGISYPMTEIPAQVLTRSDYGLPENGIIYLCCQSMFKYLPRYDYVFAEIAKRVPRSYFLFIEKPYIPSDLFKERLEKAFRVQGLLSADHCLFLPKQNTLETYMNLYNIADLFLDSLDWGAGNTALDSLACNLPVITYPGALLRSRASAGFLRLLDVPETIAHSVENYIEIAVALGTNEKLRLEICTRIGNQKHQLFEEKSCVEGLENFYRQAVIAQPKI
ncbi:MAG: O-linked N-acetylglucosamine transferase, SPINDLY family protein [Anaerolineae bacterium]|nr:O-linked N-acetylglucosamine transferase, SPINDLY family protein [Gloeobacterales cyanobacterium ES-bin-313]